MLARSVSDSVRTAHVNGRDVSDDVSVSSRRDVKTKASGMTCRSGPSV